MTQMGSGQFFQIAGADGQTIRGNVHLPLCESAGPQPLLLVCHGFKGYKDYGFFPHLTARLAETGLAAIRFNFSHSGIDDDPSTFGRPDLFERDSWSRQLVDVQAVLGAARAGELPGSERIDPTRVALLGHSRGGVTVMLTAGAEPIDETVKAVISIAAPASADNLGRVQKWTIRRKGYIASPSSRTGQELRIGRNWLDDIEQNRQRLDLPAAVGRIRAPLLLVHGSADASVPVACAEELARCYSGVADRLILDGVNHTLNCANPFTDPSPALEQVILLAGTFLHEHLG